MRARHAVALHARFGVGDGELDRGGQLDADDLALVHRQHRGVAFLEEVDRVADAVGRDLQLVVALVVHEDVVGAFAVEELHLALVDHREHDLLVGPEGAIDHGARAHVLQLRAHERATLAGLHVLELDDVHEPFGQVERHAVLQVVGGDAHNTRSFGVRVSGSEPVAATTTVSSIRTPPMPGR